MKKLTCESCGGKIEVDESNEFATCPYCNTKYKLNEDKNIIIKLDKDTKDLLKEGMNNANKSAKFVIIPIIVFAVIIFVIIISTFFSIHNNSTVNSCNDDDEFFDETDEEIDKVEEIIEESKNKISKSSFNGKYEIRSGTQYNTSINYLLDDVITNNKTNSDMLITVIYKDNNTTDPDEIINIKHSLIDWTKYEVKLDYDNDGYVNKVTIEDIN